MSQAPGEPDGVRDRGDAAPHVAGDLVGPTEPADRSRTPIMVGAIIAGLIAVAVFAIIRLSAVDRCPDAGCAAQPIQSTVPADASAKPTTRSSTDLEAATPTGPSAAAPLTAVMPADVDLTTCDTTDDDPFLDNVTAYYACKANARADLPYLQVWGYQFGDRVSYQKGVDAFNAFVKLDPTSAEGKCPPASTYGSAGWHSSAASATDAGVLECYSDSSENHYYVWTDDAEYTILVAEASPEQSFAALEAWWRQNNRNA